MDANVVTQLHPKTDRLWANSCLLDYCSFKSPKLVHGLPEKPVCTINHAA